MQKNVLICGASGMIGSAVLELCIKSDSVGKITLINRRTLGIVHAKVHEIIHHNFNDFSAIKDYLLGFDVCFYCVGVYTGQVDADQFREITVDYTKAWASVLKRMSPNLTFCFLSGAGADSTEKSKLLFAKEKGKAENYLKTLNFPHLYIFRPGYIYPITPRKEPNVMYSLMRMLYKPLNFIYPNIGIRSNKLAEFMYKTAFSDSAQQIFENKDMLKTT